MKLLIVRCGDEVDLSTLPWGTEVTVSDGATEVTGRVFPATIVMKEPTVEGNYHIKPLPSTP